MTNPCAEIDIETRPAWWGYLHANGRPQLKRWWGDHADYTTDCEGNDFVQRIVPPFYAESREEAERILLEGLK